MASRAEPHYLNCECGILYSLESFNKYTLRCYNMICQILNVGKKIHMNKKTYLTRCALIKIVIKQNLGLESSRILGIETTKTSL